MKDFINYSAAGLNSSNKNKAGTKKKEVLINVRIRIKHGDLFRPFRIKVWPEELAEGLTLLGSQRETLGRTRV